MSTHKLLRQQLSDPVRVQPRSMLSVVHYWGKIPGGQRRVVACSELPNEDWRTSGAKERVTCRFCLAMLTAGAPQQSEYSQ